MRVNLVAFLLPVLLPLAANAEPFPVKLEGETIKINITSSAESAGCAFGEINAFSRESAQGPKSFRLLFSFEPLDPADLPSRSVDIGRFDLKKKTTNVFFFPRSEERAIYALYICSDWERTGLCAGKPFAPLEQFFAGNDPRKKKIRLRREEKEDEIFYFALIALDERGGEVIRARPLSKELEIQLAKAGASRERIAEINSALESFPAPVLSAAPDGLELLFRYRDHDLCE